MAGHEDAKDAKKKMTEDKGQIRSGKVPKQWARKIAEQHVDWFLEIVRPLLITQFEHGYKHGFWDGYGDDGLYLTDEEREGS